jgi:hypothetical protein
MKGKSINVSYTPINRQKKGHFSYRLNGFNPLKPSGKYMSSYLDNL